MLTVLCITVFFGGGGEGGGGKWLKNREQFFPNGTNLICKKSAILRKIEKPKVTLHNTVEPPFNEGPTRDWQNVLAIMSQGFVISRLFFTYS